MLDKKIIKKLAATKWVGYSEEELRKHLEVCWKDYVIEKLITYDYDALEVPSLGVFKPSKKSLEVQIGKLFDKRRKHPTKSLDDKIRKYINQYKIVRRANEKRKQMGVKKKNV